MEEREAQGVEEAEEPQVLLETVGKVVLSRAVMTGVLVVEEQMADLPAELLAAIRAEQEAGTDLEREAARRMVMDLMVAAGVVRRSSPEVPRPEMEAKMPSGQRPPAEQLVLDLEEAGMTPRTAQMQGEREACMEVRRAEREAQLCKASKD